MKRVLFERDPVLPRPTMEQLIRATGCGCAPAWPEEQRSVSPSDVRILIASEHQLDERKLAQWPALELASCKFTGHDQVAKPYCRDRGIEIYCVGDYAKIPVVELELTQVVSLLRQLPEADRQVRAGLWDDDVVPGDELHGKTVGIIGMGVIGKHAARVFAALGCEVIAYTRTPRADSSPIRFVKDKGALLHEADIVLLHVPLLTKNDLFAEGGDPRWATANMIGAPELATMKRSAILVNTSRAGLVDTHALGAALTSGTIAGAVVDVFDTEPALADHPLMRLPNVRLTGHVGYKTQPGLERLEREAITNIERFLRRDPTNRIVANRRRDSSSYQATSEGNQ